MISSTKQQQYKYFQIDRQFASGNVPQIHEALDQLELFLENMTRVDLIHSLLIRLLELINSTKDLTFKHRVASLFKRHPVLSRHPHTHSQITSSLHPSLKSSDPTARIGSLGIVGDLIHLFVKDVGLYHMLMGKLSRNSCLGVQQKKEAIVCLAKLLSCSDHIARLFSKNVVDILSIYDIPLHIIMFLLTFGSPDSQTQLKVLRQILAIYQREKEKSETHRLLVVKYFERVVLRYAWVNYRIISYYESSSLSDELVRIRERIAQIKKVRHPFVNNQEQMEEEEGSLKVKDLIDQLYTSKKAGALSEKYGLYKKRILKIVDQAIFKKQQVTRQVILLLYFSEDSLEQYDSFTKEELLNKRIVCSRALFKRLAVVGCNQSAAFVLDHIDLPQLNYLFLNAFLSFKHQKEPKNISNLKEVASVVDPFLLSIIKAWELADLILRLSQASSWSAISELQKQLALIIQNLKDMEMFGDIFTVLTMFACFNQIKNIPVLKSSCYRYLPSSSSSQLSFWFAQLGKHSINYIMKMRL